MVKHDMIAILSFMSTRGPTMRSDEEKSLCVKTFKSGVGRSTDETENENFTKLEAK